MGDHDGTLVLDLTSFRINWAIFAPRSGSRLAVGSSAKMTCGFPMKARAMAARCFAHRTSD